MAISKPLEDKKVLKKNLLILIILNSSLLAFAIAYTLYFTLTEGTDIGIGCVIKDTFGFYCPGCGGSRSLRAFVTFDFLESFILYPAIPIAAVTVLSYDIRLLLTLIKKDIKYTESYKFYPFLSIPAAIILSFILKNVLLYFGIDIIGDLS